ncbi:acyltransferase [Salinilacustrithrix flava]|uniref:acyltransferase n=1 Tax=Salinilacustrithrix flava TaxID=2957203 RepID=UPI003D7C3322
MRRTLERGRRLASTATSHPRVLDARARRRLQGATSVGARPRVHGRPLLHHADVRIGDDFLCWSAHRTTHLGGSGRIDIGDRVFLNSGAVVLAEERVVIEDDVGLASDVYVADADFHALADRPLRQGPVRIGRGAWVATRAIILAGVSIGPRAVVAAGSVVTRDVPPDTLVAGVPARPVRRIDYPDDRPTAWKGPA